MGELQVLKGMTGFLPMASTLLVLVLGVLHVVVPEGNPEQKKADRQYLWGVGMFLLASWVLYIAV